MIDRLASATPQLQLRQSVSGIQIDLTRLQGELSSGRKADLARTEGSNLASLLAQRAARERLTSGEAINALAAQRLETVQSALQSLSDATSPVRTATMAALSAPSGRSVLQQTARGALAGMSLSLNAQSNGHYVFAGENAGVAPIGDPLGNDDSALRAGIIADFHATFGFDPASPQVATIGASDIQNFIDGPLAARFSETSWMQDVSRASNAPMKLPVGAGRTETPAVGANDQAMRKLAMGFSMLSDIGLERMNEAAANQVLKRALSDMEAGQSGLSGLQTEAGLAQGRVSDTATAMDVAGKRLDRVISARESIDPYQTTIEINTLTTRLEATYSLTARLQNLSLVNYLR